MNSLLHKNFHVSEDALLTLLVASIVMVFELHVDHVFKNGFGEKHRPVALNYVHLAVFLR